ncbi:MAG: peptide MFS transporter [Pseudomonadota bacterium]
MSGQTWAGHPRGLATLFFTEMFERFTYYGMRALLILFMTAPALKGGLEIETAQAGAIYGLYTGAVYLFSLPGGWIADRLLGQQRAVWYGGILIAAGNFILTLPFTSTFYLGLLTIVLGVGLLKPNISVIVGQLYGNDTGARRDAGFSIFYMGINLGAFIAPLIAGTVGETLGYRWGFFCAGVAMAIGLVQYRMTGHYLGNAGALPAPSTPAEQARNWKFVWGALVLVLAVFGLGVGGLMPLNVVSLAQYTGGAMVALAIFFFGNILLFSDCTPAEKKRVGVIAVFFAAAAVFWGGFEQQASTFNLFTRDYIDRSLFGSFFESGQHPTSWYQSANPILVILLSPFFAYFWVALGARNLDPSAPAKFGIGLLLLGVGFGVMVLAAELVISTGGKVAPTWILMTFLLQTMGELCLSPIGLSNVTKLAPTRYVSQMMGTWFLGAALGNLAAGLIGGHVGAGAVSEMPGQFMNMLLIGCGAGVVMLAFSKIINGWTGGVAAKGH